MPKRTLYVTPALQDEIAAAEAQAEAVGLDAPNWSQVFARAVRAELATLTAQELKKEKEPSMDAIVRRLRASREGRAEPDEPARLAGRSWAAEEAEWYELEEWNALLGKWTDADWKAYVPSAQVSYRDFARGGLPYWGPTSTGNIYVHVLRLIGEVVPPSDPHNRDVESCLKSDALDWWASRGAGLEPSPDYVREFIEGALEIFEQVRDSMEG